MAEGALSLQLTGSVEPIAHIKFGEFLVPVQGRMLASRLPMTTTTQTLMAWPLSRLTQQAPMALVFCSSRALHSTLLLLSRCSFWVSPLWSQ